MSENPLKKLNAEQAAEILTQYAHSNLGLGAAVSTPNYREDFAVWEAWVSGVEGYVKAYIVRLAPSNGEWVCRHITVMDAAPTARRSEG
jgi:hypothetical protein